jgi:RNA polymerase sigma factor for flagellar operon FliA
MTMKAYARTLNAPTRERDLLIAEHMGMAQRIAKKIGRRTPDWISEDDLIGAALIGLSEAAERYDNTRGEPFVAFAETRIRGAVLDELRRGDLMSRRARTAARQVGKTIRTLEHALGRQPEDHEIANALGIPLEEYRQDLEMLTHVSIVDIEPHAATLQGGEHDSPAKLTEQKQLAALLKKGLALIPERDAQILNLYYVEDLSYAEIGTILGVSESRVCQLHARAIVRLRTEVAEPEMFSEAA